MVGAKLEVTPSIVAFALKLVVSARLLYGGRTQFFGATIAFIVCNTETEHGVVFFPFFVPAFGDFFIIPKNFCARCHMFPSVFCVQKQRYMPPENYCIFLGNSWIRDRGKVKVIFGSRPC